MLPLDWNKAIRESAVEALKSQQNRLIEEGDRIYKLAELNPITMSFEVSTAGWLLNQGFPFKDRYPLNYRSVSDWSTLVGINGGVVYGTLLYKGSRRSKNWINRFVLAMGYGSIAFK